jgi:hypothetical protein
MVNEFKIFTGVLSFYIGSGMVYNEFVRHRINNWELGKLLKYMINPPTYIRVLNFVYTPILRVADYMSLQQIIAEEKMEDLNELLGRKCDDWEEH